MYQEFLDENVFIEITSSKPCQDKDTDDYAKFMKGIILNTSGIN